MESSLFPALLLDLRHGSDFAQRRFARCSRRHADGKILRDLLVEMELKFPVEFVFNALATEHCPQAELQLIEPTHTEPPSNPKECRDRPLFFARPFIS